MNEPQLQESSSPESQSASPSFAETALRLGGKSDEEARRVGAIDSADDQVEKLFRAQYQTTSSPIHRAIWERAVPAELFTSLTDDPPPAVQRVMDESLVVVRRHRDSGTLLDEQRKVSRRVLEDLAEVGYWGLLVDPAYGGSGAAMRHFAPFVTRMATLDATVAGLASVHGCIGAVDPLKTFGTPEQKHRFLPQLASGEKLSAFALTEPGAGSDLTALRTQAERSGDEFIVTGEKLFITNVVPGRVVGLVCVIDQQPAVLICELPEEENEQFQLTSYGLYALKHTHNRGIIFRGFRVPADCLLQPRQGNGLTIAYHGLNLGRVSLCATAAGTMRVMFTNILPWARFRRTYGEPIAARELVRRRLARLAGLIVACDALSAWCATLLDQGYRGEMECIVAKIFGSEAQKEAAIELLMKTHGGRSFLHGHLFGDQVHEFLAPCIYEGEGDMLGMGFFKSLVKQHGTQYLEPIGRALQAAGMNSFHPANPAHVWKLRGPLSAYAKWWLSQKLARRARPAWPPMPSTFRAHAEWAAEQLSTVGLEISRVMRKHQLRLADRQCRMAEISSRIQRLVVILCTSLYAPRLDELRRRAADILCRDLRRELVGQRPSDRDFRLANEVGAALAEQGFPDGEVQPPDPILMSYES